MDQHETQKSLLYRNDWRVPRDTHGDCRYAPADAWEIGPWVCGRNYSVGMPAQPDPALGGGLTFEFPQVARGESDAPTTAVDPLSSAREITLRCRIDAATSTRFVSSETPGQAATVSLYFQQRGDERSAHGRFGSYRWYSP